MDQMPAPTLETIPEPTLEPTSAPMPESTPMSDEDYKTGLKDQLSKLYDIGIEKMKEIIITSEKENKPTITPIDFESWYKKLYKDLFPKGDIKNTSRFNKIIQYGNFGVSQPTGGFNLKEFVTPEFIKEQYAAALRIPEPVLLVITEPFIKSDFFQGVQGVTYQIIGKETKPCGLLYNDLFKEKYSIEEDPLTQKRITIPGITVFKLESNQSGGMGNFFGKMLGKSKPTPTPSAPVQTLQQEESLRRAQALDKKLMNRSITNKHPANNASVKSNTSKTSNNSTNSILIVNFHGDSKGEQKGLDMFHKLIEQAKGFGVHFILGDSNITLGKTKELDPPKPPTTTEQVLKEKGLKNIAYSTQTVEKTREYCDILKNNQLDKYKMTSEIDGMFAVDLKYGSEAIIPDVERVTAFKTPYTKKTPMLGDHSVVGMKVTPGMTSPFTLLSATGASMDDPTKGIFRNDNEWGNVDMSTYHEEFGKPYTLAWIEVYNTWQTGFIQFVKQYGITDKELNDYFDYKKKIDEMYKKERPLTQVPTLGSTNSTIAGGSKRKAHNHISKRKAHKPRSKRKAHKPRSKRLSKRKQVRKRSRKVH